MFTSSSFRSLRSRSTAPIVLVALVAILSVINVPFSRPSPVAAAAGRAAGSQTDARWSAIDAYVERERQAARVPGIALGHRAGRPHRPPQGLRRGRPLRTRRDAANALRHRLGDEIVHRPGRHAAGRAGQGRARRARAALPALVPRRRCGGLRAHHRAPPAPPHQWAAAGRGQQRDGDQPRHARRRAGGAGPQLPHRGADRSRSAPPGSTATRAMSRWGCWCRRSPARRYERYVAAAHLRPARHAARVHRPAGRAGGGPGGRLSLLVRPAGRLRRALQPPDSCPPAC